MLKIWEKKLRFVKNRSFIIKKWTAPRAGERSEDVVRRARGTTGAPLGGDFDFGHLSALPRSFRSASRVFFIWFDTPGGFNPEQLG